jgi:quercetin dioxygenase-like cupin family protein
MTDTSTGKSQGAVPVLLKQDELEFLNADWGQLTWYANKQLGNTDYLTLGRCILYRDQANPRHYHPNCDEILTVLQGRIRHTWINGDEIEMNEGDTITIPAGMPHQARNIGPGIALLIIAFTAADRQTIGET